MPTYDLGLEHVSLAFATKTVFTDVTQGVFEGDRIGIVGRNGDGKSTLLKLLAGTQEPDSGRVTRRNGLTFGMLTQRDTLDDNATLREAALEGREDYEWASQQQSREIVEALLGGMNLDAKVGSLSGGQRRRADLARLLLKEWDILALDEPTNHLDVITIHWLAEHLKNRWNRGTGALLLVTHDRWFLDEVCESMWEVHDGRIEPFEGGYSAYMLQRVERDRQADVRETKRRNLARKELAWLSRGARARSTKQKFHVKAATELIADVPPIRNTVELKQMATSRLGKQVVDLVDVTQIYDREQGSYADIDPDAAALAANTRSASTVDVVEPMVREPQVFGSVTIAVDDADDPRLTSAFGARAGEVAAEHGLTHHEPEGEINALRGTRGEAETAPDETSAAVEITVSGRKILDDVTWLIGPGDRFGIVGANGAGKSTTLRAISGLVKPSDGSINFMGRDITTLNSQKIVAEGIALVPEGRRVFANLTVKENLKIGAYLRKDRDEIEEGIKEIYRRFPRLREREWQLAGTLSGGEQQMLAVGRAMMAKPKLMMMDEPSLGLAPLVVRDIFAIIRELKSEGITILLIEQNANAALRCADYGFVMETGRITLTGTGEELLCNEAVKAAYLGSN